MCQISHINKHMYPIWCQPSILTMHNFGVVFITWISQYLLNPKYSSILSSSIFIGIGVQGFGSASCNLALLFSLAFQIKTPSYGLQYLGVAQRSLYCITLSIIAHLKPKIDNIWYVPQKILAINNIILYKSLEVMNLFDQMENHWNNVQIHVRIHEYRNSWESSSCNFML